MTADLTAAPSTALSPAARIRIADALSPHTRRAYSGAWRRFADWMTAQGAEPLGAAPEHVADYLTARAANGRSVATLRLDAAAITAAHEAAGLASPLRSPALSGRRGILAGLAKRAAREGRGQRQAAALTDAALSRIAATARLPRTGPTGRTESESAAARRGALDVALCLTMSDAGLRRSEAAALVWADLTIEPDGSGRLTIRRSKTDADGRGAVVAISRSAVRALLAIRGGAPADARIFPLEAATIGRRIRTAARAAGLGEGYSGHSGRVGLARRMTAKGAPTAAVQLQGRWRDPGMVSRYTRAEAAGAALAYISEIAPE